MRKVLVGISIMVAGLAMTRAAGATPLATLTWRTEVNTSGQLCVYGTFDDRAFDVFGTSVNLSSTNPWLCTGQVGVPFVTVHCEAVAGPTVLSYDVSVPYDGSPGPPPGIFSPFVGAMTNVSGSAFAGLGSLTYTVDGQQAQRAIGLTANDIPGCSISGGVSVFDGLGGINAFQSVPTSTGTDIPVNTTLTFTDPITGQPHSSDVGITFDNVGTSGNTVVTVTSNAAGSLASNFAVSVGGYNAVYVDVSTTATFTGNVTVCGGYDDADNDGYLDGTGVPETALHILHGEGGTFVDRTVSQDLTANIICAEVSSLSPFVIAVDVGTQVSHDGVVLPVAPVKITIPAGKTQIIKPVKVTVRNADLTESAGHTAKLSIIGSTCPARMLRDASNNPVVPDFNSTSAVSDTVTIIGNKTKVATIPLTVNAGDFATPNIKAPVRCTITVSTTTVAAGTVIDPTGSNNTAVIDIDVIDKNP